MFTKEQYLEMILDELDFIGFKPSNKLVAYLNKATKIRLVKFYEILCDECLEWHDKRDTALPAHVDYKDNMEDWLG
jgi:hypothetical protein